MVAERQWETEGLGTPDPSASLLQTFFSVNASTVSFREIVESLTIIMSLYGFL